MIDPNDQNTTSLPLDEAPAKRKRGRPSTGQALSRAEIQRQYRERRKSNVTDNAGEIEALKAEINELKIALGKAVIARKRAEEKIITVTENDKKKEPRYDVQMRPKGSKKRWKTLTREEGFLTEERAAECVNNFIEMDKEKDIHYEYRVKGLA